MITVPIVLLTYARLDHTKRTIKALLQNDLASESDLIVYSDAARSIDKQDAVGEVRAYIETICGFRSVTIKHCSENYGLSKSIISGVTEVLQQSDRVIVLEDDMVTSPHFLSYMNDALERYAEDKSVASIHGYIYPITQPLQEAFFIPGADCWGWATWKRGWECFNSDGQYLLDELKRRKLIRAFDFNGTFPYSKMLEDQIKGKNDSWAIRWYASAFLAGKLTLYPGRSLVQNIGNDNSGTHCGETDTYDTVLSKTPINLDKISVTSSDEALYAFEAYFKQVKISLSKRLTRRLSNLLSTSWK